MLDEEFAGFENRRRCRQCHDSPNHDVGNRLVGRAKNQTSRRHHALEAATFVQNEEVDDAFGRWMFAQPVQGLPNGLPDQEGREILMHALSDQVTEMIRTGLRH